MTKRSIFLFLCFFSVCVAEPDLGKAKHKFKVPELNDEEDIEYGSRFLTDNLKCDGCLAVTFQFHKNFQAKHKNRPEGLGNLPAHEVIEILGKQISI